MVKDDTQFIMRGGKAIRPDLTQDGLELWYDMKGKTNTDTHNDYLLDLSGNNRAGTLQNFAFMKGSGYKDGLVFDGIDDNLTRPAIDTIEPVSGSRNLLNPDFVNWFSLSGSSNTIQIKLKPDTAYTMSGNVPGSTSGESTLNRHIYLGGNGIGDAVFDGQSVTKTTDSEGNLVIHFYLNRQYHDDIVNQTYWWQIEEGSTATPYTPYIPSAKFTYQLNGNILSYNEGGIVRRVQNGQVIERKGINLVRNGNFFDGTSRWNMHSSVLSKSQNGVISEGEGGASYVNIYQSIKTFPEKKYAYYYKARPLTDGFDFIRAELRLDGGLVYSRRNNFDKKNQWINDVGIIDTSGYGEYSGYIRILAGCPDNTNMKMEVSNIQLIDLTAAYGPGNEPTLEEMQAEPDKWAWTPNPLDLLETTDLKGNIVGDVENIIDDYNKDEVSGQSPVYTDKADDSVVRVDIDGKSEQEVIVSNPNLLQGSDFEEGFSTYWRGTSPEIVSDDDYGNVAKIVTTSTTGMYQPPKEPFIRGQSYTVSVYAKASVSDFTFYVAIDGNGASNAESFQIGTNWEKITATFTNVAANENIRFYGAGEFYIARPKAEKGEKATYPKPSPDYPSEIMSLSEKSNKTNDNLVDDPFYETGDLSKYEIRNAGYAELLIDKNNKYLSYNTLRIEPQRESNGGECIIFRTGYAQERNQPFTFTAWMKAEQPSIIRFRAGWDSYLRSAEIGVEWTKVKISPNVTNMTSSYPEGGQGLSLFLFTETGTVPFNIALPKIEYGEVATDFFSSEFDVVSSVGGRNYYILSKAKEYVGLTWALGSEYNNNTGALVSDFIEVKTGEVWQLSSDNNSFDVHDFPFQHFFYNKNKEYIYSVSEFLNEIPGTDTPRHGRVPDNKPKDKKPAYMRVTIWGGFLDEINTDKDGLRIKLEKGPTATPYTPAPEDIPYDTETQGVYKTNITLDEPLRSVGDVHDKLFKNSDGLWKVERNIGEVNDWTDIGISNKGLVNGSVMRFETALNTKPMYEAVISNRLKQNEVLSYGGITEESIDSHPSHGTIICWIKPERLNSLDSAGFKEWLIESRFKIQYILRNPVIETLSDDLQLKLNAIESFDGDNYVYIVDDSGVSPNLHARFKPADWYKENLLVNNLLIWNRPLNGNELLHNYQTIKDRWGI